MDKAIKKQFKEQVHTFDIGGLDARYNAAKAFNETYCKGTPYYAKVEEYCAGCTVTTLRMRDQADYRYTGMFEGEADGT